MQLDWIATTKMNVVVVFLWSVFILQSLKIGAFTCICFIINSDDDGDYVLFSRQTDRTDGRTRLICNDALNNVKANYVNKKKIT